MIDKIRQFWLALNERANRHALTSDMRRLAIGTASRLRSGETLSDMVSGIADISDRIDAEHATWASPADIDALLTAIADDPTARLDRPFDACELRIWLALARAAGVPHVPAREILTLSENELDLLSGEVQFPDTPATRAIRAAAEDLLSSLPDAANAAPQPSAPAATIEELAERLYDAMDDVPEGWMVRSNRCGSSDLKTLAMVGITDNRPPEVRFGANLEIGPGWIRAGNRRRINAADRRIIESAAQGPGGVTFLARPWQAASRFCVAEDPHRAGTPMAGKGAWPAEWRAIVENGEVIAVASYYGWADQATPYTARMALTVQDRAQRIADLAARIGAWPRYLDVELGRHTPMSASVEDLDDALESRFGRKSVCCTLDFIETDQGPVLLEAGPGITPLGGSHPCAFAGIMNPRLGDIPNLSGVAFRTTPHVVLGDMTTWTDGERAGCILSWEEVEDLACR